MTTLAPSAARLDVRAIPCRSKHSLIFDTWNELSVGDAFVLVNDHDPIPLYYQFSAMFAGAFSWEYQTKGPDEFAVLISRLGPNPAQPAVPPPGAPVAPPSPDKPVTGSQLLDVRGLEPPQPMQKILAATTKLTTAATLIAHLDRRPIYLLPELEQRGLHYTEEEQSDGSWRLDICRPDA